MNARRRLFRTWIFLTIIYEISGIINSADSIYMKFHLGAQGRWLHLVIAVTMAVGVPAFVLGLGWMLFWIVDGIQRRSSSGPTMRLP
jgi:hypothetical protein